MAYEQLNLERFKKKLSDNIYPDAGSAKKAIGKAAGMSDGDKDKARKAVESHAFGGAPKPKEATPGRRGRKKAVVAEAAAEKKVPQNGRRKRHLPEQKSEQLSLETAMQTVTIPAPLPSTLNYDDIPSMAESAETLRLSTISTQSAFQAALGLHEQRPDLVDLDTYVRQCDAALAAARDVHVASNLKAKLVSEAALRQYRAATEAQPENGHAHEEPTEEEMERFQQSFSIAQQMEPGRLS